MDAIAKAQCLICRKYQPEKKHYLTAAEFDPLTSPGAYIYCARFPDGTGIPTGYRQGVRCPEFDKKDR